MLILKVSSKLKKIIHERKMKICQGFGANTQWRIIVAKDESFILKMSIPWVSFQNDSGR